MVGDGEDVLVAAAARAHHDQMIDDRGTVGAILATWANVKPNH